MSAAHGRSEAALSPRGGPARSAEGHNMSAAPTTRRALGGYGAAIAALHLLGWGLCLSQTTAHPVLLGLGLSAYLFGLRHAFDADHIAAVDDTVRLMLGRGREPLGVGFYFSLGHASVVFALVAVVAFAATLVRQHLPGLEAAGKLIGPLVSGIFLWVVGSLNFRVLLDMLQIWRRRHVPHRHHAAELDALLARRGLLNRLFGRSLTRRVRHSWQMYPIGLLFGLGFDTATEIALLTLASGAATSQVPVGGVLALPILFAAGMSLIDTADGVLMVRAYGWALDQPIRRIGYNLATTALSVVVALGIGTLELVRLLIGWGGLRGPAADALGRLSLGALGYVVVGLFVGAWVVSYAGPRAAARAPGSSRIRAGTGGHRPPPLR